MPCFSELSVSTDARTHISTGTFWTVKNVVPHKGPHQEAVVTSYIQWPIGGVTSEVVRQTQHNDAARKSNYTAASHCFTWDHRNMVCHHSTFQTNIDFSLSSDGAVSEHVCMNELLESLPLCLVEHRTINH